MHDEYQIGKDIGRIQAQLEALQRERRLDCGCGSAREKKPRSPGARPTSACSPDDWRTVAMMVEKSSEIKTAIERALREAGIVHADGSPLFLARIGLTKDSAAPKPDICACCTDGSYTCCGIPGCDPCEPVPISFATPTSP